VLDKNINRADNYRLIANGHLQANILEGLNVKTQYGIDFTDGEDFQSLDPFHGDGGGSSQGIMNRVANRILRWNWQNTVNFKRTFADSHNLGVTIGNEYQLTSYRYFIASGTTFSDPFFLRNELIGGSFATQESGGDYAEEGFESLFGRLNYDFNGRYLFSFSVRNDGISSLPEANRKGTFLGASVGWVVSDEVFFNVSFIDQLKVRGSYAEVGNTAITSLVSPYVFFPYSGTYAPEIYGSQSGISFSNVGNASLKWETSKKLDIGIDLSMLNNRITLAADYFQNDISDMIMNAPTPPTAGLPGNSISKNVGSMINKGIELTIGTDNLVAGPLKWTTDVTFTYNVNEITALNDDEDMIFTYNINRVGHSIGSIYGYDYTGVNPANGNPLYRKGDGTIVQGNVTDNRYYLFNPEDPSDLSQQTTALSATLDRKILGNTAPKFFGGINNTWRWKNFDLELFLVYSGGNKVLNVTRQSMMAQEFVNNHKDILNRWTPENPNTDIPRLSLNNSAFLNLEGSASSRFVEDGDFLRVQNISLGYDLPKSLLNTVAGGAVRNLRIYTQVRNAFVFTKYRGGDPELNFSNVTNSQTGIDFSTNPLMRTFTVGLSIGL
jgi:TonB-linked SusC/RagA family outer membrane protein